MEDISNNYKHIKGWGIDADPANEPTYPMKRYTGDDHERLNYHRPPQQPVNDEILRSNERPYITAAFGTSTPPSGLSGRIRRYAFRYSEGSFAHWLPLILADRVNAIEGIIDDIRDGHVPNIFAERGWKAEWKHKPERLVRRVVIGLLITSAIVVWMRNKNRKELLRDSELLH
jgi:hypothetical protein